MTETPKQYVIEISRGTFNGYMFACVDLPDLAAAKKFRDDLLAFMRDHLPLVGGGSQCSIAEYKPDTQIAVGGRLVE